MRSIIISLLLVFGLFIAAPVAEAGPSEDPCSGLSSDLPGEGCSDTGDALDGLLKSGKRKKCDPNC